jgi:hypothetical protein
MIDLNNNIDTNLFNKFLRNGGASPIITKKNVISMKAFITILLKLFRKNYLSINRKGGFYNGERDLGIFNVALKYGELNYDTSYVPPSKSLLERDFI